MIPAVVVIVAQVVVTMKKNVPATCHTNNHPKEEPFQTVVEVCLLSVFVAKELGGYERIENFDEKMMDDDT